MERGSFLKHGPSRARFASPSSQRTAAGLDRNFEQAVAAVEADIVFSSDQDDIWFPDKVRSLAAVFERNQEVMLVHTDAMLADAQGNDMGTTLLANSNYPEPSA